MSNSVGIEQISFYTTNLFISLEKLATTKGIDANKYTAGLGQEKMSIITPDEDIITLAYNAVRRILNNVSNAEKEKIELLLFATESGIDNSKSASVELFNLLDLSNHCCCLEIKQACYGGTGALMLARDFVKANPKKKALVVMSDIAYYGLNTSGEPTQGCGAVAVLLSSNPKIATFNNDNVVISKLNNDFYRPTYCETPICDGHFSIKCYLSMFQDAFEEWKKRNKNSDFSHLVCHSPFTKMLDKCCKIANVDAEKNENNAIKQYNKITGNTYTASLYVGLISLLENSLQDLTNKNIALFSYGSGSVCEMFSIQILEGYKNYLLKQKHEDILKNRQELKYKDYQNLMNQFANREKQLNWQLEKLEDEKTDKNTKEKKARLIKISNGIRQYEIV